MKRVVSFIDGFNLYHSVCDLKQNYLKWTNLRALSEAFIKKSQERLIDAYFFTAYATWREQSHLRHIKYVQALEAYGVKTVLGHFKEKQRNCQKCSARFKLHEEKQTDVNIAIHLLNLAHKKGLDKALIVTADSDLCPVIDLVTENFPNIEISILVPPNRYEIARELRSKVPTFKIKRAHLENNLLPAEIKHPETGQIIHMPHEYKKR